MEKSWPNTSADAIARYNANRIEINGENPITAFQIMLQMAHRIVALAIFILVAACAWMAHRWSSRFSVSRKHKHLKVELQLGRRISIFWLALIVAQIALRRVDGMVEQGRRRGDGARANRRAFARDRRALVHHCFRRPIVIAGNCPGQNPFRHAGRVPRPGRQTSEMKEITADILTPAPSTAAEKSWSAVFADLVKARLTTLVLLTTLVGFYAGWSAR